MKVIITITVALLLHATPVFAGGMVGIEANLNSMVTEVNVSTPYGALSSKYKTSKAISAGPVVEYNKGKYYIGVSYLLSSDYTSNVKDQTGTDLSSSKTSTKDIDVYAGMDISRNFSVLLGYKMFTLNSGSKNMVDNTESSGKDEMYGPVVGIKAALDLSELYKNDSVKTIYVKLNYMDLKYKSDSDSFSFTEDGYGLLFKLGVTWHMGGLLYMDAGFRGQEFNFDSSSTGVNGFYLSVFARF